MRERGMFEQAADAQSLYERHHDIGYSTRADREETALSLMLDGETWGPAWLCISTQPVHGQQPRGPRDD